MKKHFFVKNFSMLCSIIVYLDFFLTYFNILKYALKIIFMYDVLLLIILYIYFELIFQTTIKNK